MPAFLTAQTSSFFHSAVCGLNYQRAYYLLSALGVSVSSRYDKFITDKVTNVHPFAIPKVQRNWFIFWRDIIAPSATAGDRHASFEADGE